MKICLVEVDFAVKEGRNFIRLLQVSLSIEDHQTLARETRSLISATKETGCKDLLLIVGTKNQQAPHLQFKSQQLKIEDANIKVVSIEEFLE